ncbi:MAG: prepilin-type N-terminal cleavage/methylation domain-containing protein [Bdellovibrionales bacterium]|nr:prepilin-type N-terminal cleavage/methylation domain-containing protein [Bdellovibrionales bacterium]
MIKKYKGTFKLKGVRVVNHRGFSMIELLITMVVIIGLISGTILSLGGLQDKDELDQAATQISNDLLFIRSKSVSSITEYRVNFTSETEWQVEFYDDATSTWTLQGTVRSLPSGIELTDESLVNVGSNLVATPRGIFEFQNGADGDPFLILEGNSKNISISVDSGGTVEKKKI